jgi:hypothetical protein
MIAQAENSQARRETCWPDALEILLLRAGLCDGPAAVQAWKDFCDRIDSLETLPEGYYRLLPLVAGHLQFCEEPLPHRERILGVLRHAWAKNQRLLAEILPLLRALQKSGIDFLLLKGAAFSEFYREYGSVRPMADVDILIHPEDVAQAVELLRGLGCASPMELSPQKLEELVRFRHELTMKTASGPALDLHWYLVSDARHPEAQDYFWRDAGPCRLGNLEAKTLNRTDQLLHSCLHGAVWNEISPVRWLADSVMLIRAGVDWERLEKQSRRLEHLQPVRDTILFLDSLGIGLAPEVVEHWRKLEVTRREEAEFGYRARLPNARERTRHLAWLYLRLHREDSLAKMMGSVPGYMRQLHHFRAYSRRAAFLSYLLIFFFTQNARAGKPCGT